MSKRIVAVAALAAVAAAAAAYFTRPAPLVPPDAPTQEQMARAVGADVMLHLQRGHVPGRSGDLMVVPKPHNYMISDWDLRSLGSEPEIKTTHPNPWNFLTRVPIALYGAPYVPAGVVSHEPIDISALAPTYARLLGLDDLGTPSCSLEAIVPCDAAGPPARRPPKVIFTVVIDGGGWNVLERYPDAWPNVARLFDAGLLYDNATIGSAPSTTGALHATFGTGFYPVDHGIPGNILRTEDGEIEDVYLDDADPRFLEKPTVSELWDEATGNEAIVATVSYEGWHLGMIGHGAQRAGGDKDLAAIWARDDREWEINEDFYELPAHLRDTDLAALRQYERAMDGNDGKVDGRWFSETLQSVRRNKNERPSTPAYVHFTGDAVVELLENEGIGRDRVTDLVWVEMKAPDSAGHAWNMVNPEVEDTVKATDGEIGRFVETLDRLVGSGEYVVAISADHGQQPIADSVGGWRINTSELVRDIETRFGNVVDAPSPADIYLSPSGLVDAGVEAGDIARWLATYTVAENLPDDAPGRDLVPEDVLDDTLYAGAFSSDFLAGLDPDTIASYGNGRYPEGDLFEDD